MPTSVSVACFSKLLQKCRPAGGFGSRIAIALSGGPDSTALAYLLLRHARELPERDFRDICAITIDHGLRPESSREAATVQQWAENAGLKHELIRIPWGVKPFPALSATGAYETKARQARLTIFNSLLRRNHISHLFVAHHLDDQVETALLRQARGTRTALAMGGMLPYSRLPDGIDVSEATADGQLHVVRPLLGVSKLQLLQICRNNNLPFATDPTNSDPGYTARNRLRHDLQALQQRVSTLRSSLLTAEARVTALECHISKAQSETRILRESYGPLNAYLKWEERLSSRRAKLSRIVLDLAQDAPLVTFVITTSISFDSMQFGRQAPEIRKLLLAHFVRQLSPTSSSLSPQNLDLLDRVVFGLAHTRTKVTPGAGVIFTPAMTKGRRLWVISKHSRQVKRDQIYSPYTI